MKWIIKNKWKLIIVLLLGIGASIFSANLIVVNSAENKTFDELNAIPYNKAGLLLGTSKRISSGLPNEYFLNRIAAAVELYKSGKIKYVIVSGDNSTKYYNEPTDMKKALIRAGVDSSRIISDYAGLRTFDSVIRAKEVFGQNSITIISQKFHNERAIYFAEKNGMNAVGFNAKDVDKYYGFKTNLREKLARVDAVLNSWFGAKPKFLGEKVILD